MGGFFFSSPKQSYLLISTLPSEEVITLTSKIKNKYVLIGPFSTDQEVIGVCKVIGVVWCLMSVKQRGILKIKDAIEFPGKRPETLFWISQKQK